MKEIFTEGEFSSFRKSNLNEAKKQLTVIGLTQE